MPAADSELDRGALAPRGPRHRRQDEHARARASARRPSRALFGADAQPVEPRRARPAARAAARRRPSPRAWCRWRTRTTAAARSASPRRAAASSASSRRAARNPLGPTSATSERPRASSTRVTRSVRDSAALLDATAGPRCSAIPTPRPPPARPFLDEVARLPGKLRIALHDARRDGVCRSQPTACAPSRTPRSSARISATT